MITIVDEFVAEYDESFTFSLVRPPDLHSWIGISSDSSAVKIIDDDGNT